jgi:hypothetical protein
VYTWVFALKHAQNTTNKQEMQANKISITLTSLFVLSFLSSAVLMVHVLRFLLYNSVFIRVHLWVILKQDRDSCG